MARRDGSRASIVPPQFADDRSYVDALNAFLGKHQILFTANVYRDKLLVRADKGVHCLMTGQYELLPEDWRHDFFDRLREVVRKRPKRMRAAVLYIITVVSKELLRGEELDAAEQQAVAELSREIPPPASLLAFVEESAALTSYGLKDAEEMQDPDTKEWYVVHRKGVLQPVATSFMSQKKKYETKVFGDEITRIAAEDGVGTVVDIGCGKGYVTQYVAMHSRLRVVGVEGNPDFTAKMERRTDALQSRAAKRSGATQDGGFNRSEGKTAFLTVDTSADEFRRVVGLGDETVLLTGLHPCGDLTPTLLRLFRSLEQIRCLAVVGCCYHKLTENPAFFRGEENADAFGFPMSQYLLKDRPVTFHLAQTYITSNPFPLSRTLAEWFYAMKMQSYRAALELYLHTLAPEFLEVHYTGKIRQQFTTSFGDYFLRALANVREHAKTFCFTQPEYRERFAAMVDELAKKDHLREELNAWYETLCPADEILFECVPFIVFQTRVSQLLENFVVLDRALFLQEFCSEVSVRRIFHPIISPRGLLVSAKK